MMFHKVTLLSKEKLTLTEKKSYINSMYREESNYISEKKRNQGFITKFNNSIGFKPVVSTVTSNDTIIPETIDSPESYLSPYDILLENLHTPVDSEEIICFYLEDKQMVHPNPQLSYETKIIAEKWKDFLQKVFPQLVITLEVVEEMPRLSVREFALQYFYRSLSQKINYTIEFSSKDLLNDDEIKDILAIIQGLSDDKITIGQNYCSTCVEYSSGSKPYHIEIVYLTFYGRDNEKKAYEEYGDGIYKLA